MTKGFALPTVLITSVVMLMLLLSGLTATSGISASIRHQYNQELVKEAADAGLRMVVACIQNRTVHTSGLLQPNSTSCKDTATTTSKSAYVLDSPLVKSRFEVSPPVEEEYPDARYYNIESVGYVDLFRSGNPTTKWKTLKETVSLKIQYRSKLASSSVSGSSYSCGIVNGNTYCWGINTRGELGNGLVAPPEEEYHKDASGNPALARVVRYAPGTDYHHQNSELGESLSKDLAIALGLGSTCSISSNSSDPGDLYSYYSARKVACWGDSANGELGRGIVTTDSTPYPRLTYQTWATEVNQSPRQIVAGATFVCLITNRASGDTSGNTWCWGDNNRGQIATGTRVAGETFPSPQRALDGPGSAAVLYDIAAGPDATHLCGRSDGDKMKCWGWNYNGQVGDGTDGTEGLNDASTTRQRFKKYVTQVIASNNEEMRVLPGPKSFDVGSLPGNEGHTCAIGKGGYAGSPNILEGRIYCWGANGYGQLGRGVADSTLYRRPELVTAGFGGTNYSASMIAASNVSTCALVKVPASAATSSLYCWGSNEWGEVGLNDTTTQTFPQPTRVPFFDGLDITDISGGAYRFCAVADQSVYCWGRDHVGQVGDGFVNIAEYEPSLAKFLEQGFKGLSY